MEMEAAAAHLGLFDDDLQLDSLFAAGDFAVSDLFDPAAPPQNSPPAAASSGSPESVNSYPVPGAMWVSASEESPLEFSEIERFLMEDGDADVSGAHVEGFDVEEFFESVFAAGDGDGDGDGSEEQGSEVGPTEGEARKEEADVAVDVEAEAEVEVVDGDDPISKKKRRQMKNRDSAMKSRERKRTYVKDLEMKSKYLEAECRRLSYALQCCVAENMALRQSLPKDRPLVAPVVMQESAVLTETLPLVSLLWLVGIVCLFLMPGLPSQKPMAPSSLGRDLVMVAGRMTRRTISDEPGRLELILQRRRCRGARTRMKFACLPWQAVAGC